MNSRVLNNRLRQAYGRGFRLHTPCFLNDCYTNGMARMENVSSQQKLQLLPAGGSMPAALSDQNAPRAHIPHYHGENLSKTLGDIKRLVSGCTLRWNSKPLDDEHAFSPVFLGHTKFSARYLNTSASAVSTRPAGSCARHSRALSTSSGETVKEKEGRMSTDQEREVDVSEADDGMSGATVQEPKNTPVEMPKITDVSTTTAVHPRSIEHSKSLIHQHAQHPSQGPKHVLRSASHGGVQASIQSYIVSGIS